MGSLQRLLTDLDEETIARRVTRLHDTVRRKYALFSTTVRDYSEYEDILSDYYQFHFENTFSPTASFSRADSLGLAKQLIEQEYGRRGLGRNAAFSDALYGTNGGMGHILNTLAEALKAEAIRHYVTDKFDHHVSPCSWEEKVHIVRQFLKRFEGTLPASIRLDEPERYARDYRELVQLYSDALRNPKTYVRDLSL